MLRTLKISKASQTDSGFTLIELLIVIVIIGILAGVLISVINPAQQANRARDAGVQAAMNKVSLGTEGFISAYGRAPTGAEFKGALQNVLDFGATCGAGDSCTYSVTGNPLPVGGVSGCGGDNYSGVGANQCYYFYERILGVPPAASIDKSTTFNVYAKSFGIADKVFKYTNDLGRIATCPATAVNAGAEGCTE